MEAENESEESKNRMEKDILTKDQQGKSAYSEFECMFAFCICPCIYTEPSEPLETFVDVIV